MCYHLFDKISIEFEYGGGGVSHSIVGVEGEILILRHSRRHVESLHHVGRIIVTAEKPNFPINYAEHKI